MAPLLHGSARVLKIRQALLVASFLLEVTLTAHGSNAALGHSMQHVLVK